METLVVSTQPSPDTSSSTPPTSPTVPALRTSESRSSDWPSAGTCRSMLFWSSRTRWSPSVAAAIAMPTVSSGNSARKPKKVTAPASRFPPESLTCW